jgi:transposase
MRMTTKTHSVVDAYGNPIALKLTEDPAGHSSTTAAVRRRPKGGV